MGVKEDFFRLKTACLEAKGSDREKAEQEMDRFFDSLRPEDQQELQAAIDEDFVRIHQVVDDAKKMKNRLKCERSYLKYFHSSLSLNLLSNILINQLLGCINALMEMRCMGR